jgi:hypothetical protein
MVRGRANYLLFGKRPPFNVLFHVFMRRRSKSACSEPHDDAIFPLPRYMAVPLYRFAGIEPP